MKENLVEFLPTVNLVPWSGPVCAAIVGLAILVLIGIAIAHFVFKKDTIPVELVLIATTFAVLVFCVVAGAVHIAESRNGQANLQQNLQQKYEVASVEYNAESAPIRATEKGNQLIIVNLEDGKQATFVLTQHIFTNEPTLAEVPGDSSVSLEEITR